MLRPHECAAQQQADAGQRAARRQLDVCRAREKVPSEVRPHQVGATPQQLASCPLSRLAIQLHFHEYTSSHGKGLRRRR